MFFQRTVAITVTIFTLSHFHFSFPQSYRSSLSAIFRFPFTTVLYTPRTVVCTFQSKWNLILHRETMECSRLIYYWAEPHSCRFQGLVCVRTYVRAGISE